MQRTIASRHQLFVRTTKVGTKCRCVLQHLSTCGWPKGEGDGYKKKEMKKCTRSVCFVVQKVSIKGFAIEGRCGCGKGWRGGPHIRAVPCKPLL